MPKLDYVILDLLESTARNVKTHPLNLGGISGSGGGAGSPPGGFVGWLPQTRVAYDEDELGVATTSGVPSLLDNLNHIRFRLDSLEASSGVLIVEEQDGAPSVSSVDRIIFSGALVTDLGSGDVLVQVFGSGGGVEEAPLDGNQYARQSGDWVVVSGGSADVTHYYNEDLTPQVPTTNFNVSRIFAAGTLKLYYNGIRQRKEYDYTEDGGYNSFTTAFTTYSGDVVIVDYDCIQTPPSGILHAYNEDLTGQVPSSIFNTTQIYSSGTLAVFYNGIRQRKDYDYNEDGGFNSFTANFTTYSGDVVVVDYNYL
jgi:hypothetical protein